MPSTCSDELISRFIESLDLGNKETAIRKAIDFGYALCALETAEKDKEKNNDIR